MHARRNSKVVLKTQTAGTYCCHQLSGGIHSLEGRQAVPCEAHTGPRRAPTRGVYRLLTPHVRRHLIARQVLAELPDKLQRILTTYHESKSRADKCPTKLCPVDEKNRCTTYNPGASNTLATAAEHKGVPCNARLQRHSFLSCRSLVVKPAQHTSWPLLC